MRRALAILLGCIAVPTGAWAADAAETQALRFCMCSDTMPHAGRAADGQPMGTDVLVAELLAEKLQRACQLHWCANDRCRLQSLRDGRCDVVVGLPRDSVNSSDLVWAGPYAAGKFGLVVDAAPKAPLIQKKGAPPEQGSKNGAGLANIGLPREESSSAAAGPIRSLIDLRGKRVGIVAGTVALPKSDHEIVAFPSREALLRGFRQAQLAGALIDTDFAAWYLRKHTQLELRLVDEFVSQFRWSLGLAVRARDTSLQAKLAQAVTSCLQSAAFQPVFAKLGLRHRPPLMDLPKRKPTTDTWARTEQDGKLIVSMDPANLPYSSADPEQPGFDVIIAQQLGRELGVDIEIKWIDVHRETAIGQLLENECDLAFGAAVDPRAMDDEEAVQGKVIYSRPYYGTGYFLVASRDADPVQSLQQLKGERSRRLGTQAGTVADYSLRQRGYLRRLFGTQLAVLTALDRGGIDYAYLWSNAGWLLHGSPDFDAVVLPDFVPEDRWNIAVAMRHGDKRLKQHVDRAIGALVKKGFVARALKRYHTPHIAPFEEGSGAASSRKTQRPLAPIERGLEPHMAGRQHSRQPYDDLQRIQTRGTLIVGLDQNNLPFSTTHSEPAGLDYEVAQLLAQEMGVSLEVYWAYSSHDSYPGKLASKKLCDVILGVVPDDRFAQRVTYSEPYYFANYQYVVSAAGEPVTEKLADLERLRSTQAIAVEAGLAVRGVTASLQNRYANLGSILQAVAVGEAKAGYVLASRARWMAAENFPEQLRFVQPKPPVDQFPVCIAMRRGQTELKNQIDTRLTALRTTGRLEQVFSRWHLPKEASTIHGGSPQ